MIKFKKGELVLTDKDWEEMMRVRLAFYSGFKYVPCHKALKLPRMGGKLTPEQVEQIIKRWKERRKNENQKN